MLGACAQTAGNGLFIFVSISHLVMLLQGTKGQAWLITRCLSS